MLKFGLIPEFIGRLPVITNVRSLDRDALVRILTEPRNALVRQYQRLFELDNVELEFEPTALEAIADQAILRGTGARGLRAIMEEVLLSVMYEVPSNPDAARVLITREVVLENVNPTIVPRELHRPPGAGATARRSRPDRPLRERRQQPALDRGAVASVRAGTGGTVTGPVARRPAAVLGARTGSRPVRRGPSMARHCRGNVTGVARCASQPVEAVSRCPPRSDGPTPVGRPGRATADPLGGVAAAASLARPRRDRAVLAARCRPGTAVA